MAELLVSKSIYGLYIKVVFCARCPGDYRIHSYNRKKIHGMLENVNRLLLGE